MQLQQQVQVVEKYLEQQEVLVQVQLSYDLLGQISSHVKYNKLQLGIKIIVRASRLDELQQISCQRKTK